MVWINRLGMPFILAIVSIAVADASSATFKVYRGIQQTLADEQPLSDQQVRLLDSVFSQVDQVAQIKRLNEKYKNAFEKRGLQNVDEPRLKEVSDNLYRVFASAEMHSDVVFQFLDTQFKRVMDLEEPKVAPLGGRGRLYAWYWGDLGRATLYMYQVTGEERYLDLFFGAYARLLELRDDRLGLVDDRRGRIVRSWGSYFSDTSIRTNEITVAGLVVLPATEFLLAFRDRPEREKYQEQYEMLEKLASETLAEFQPEMITVPGSSQGYYLHPVTGDVEALNHTHVYAAALANLYAVNKDDDARRIVESVCNYFRHNMWIEENGSYAWSYAPTPAVKKNWWGELLGAFSESERKPEATWKASVTIELVVAGKRAGLCFDDNDMERFARTFNENIYRDVSSINQHIGFRSPRFFNKGFSSRENLDESVVSWSAMGMWFPEISMRTRELVAHRPDLFEDGWLAGARPVIRAYALLQLQQKHRLDVDAQ